jgi:hypothetical protein
VDAEYVRQLARSGEGGLPGWVKTEMDVADQAAGGYVDSDIVERGADGALRRPTTSLRPSLSSPTPQQGASSTASRSPSKVGG